MLIWQYGILRKNWRKRIFYHDNFHVRENYNQTRIAINVIPLDPYASKMPIIKCHIKL